MKQQMNYEEKWQHKIEKVKKETCGKWARNKHMKGKIRVIKDGKILAKYSILIFSFRVKQISFLEKGIIFLARFSSSNHINLILGKLHWPPLEFNLIMPNAYIFLELYISTS